MKQNVFTHLGGEDSFHPVGWSPASMLITAVRRKTSWKYYRALDPFAVSSWDQMSCFRSRVDDLSFPRSSISNYSFIRLCSFSVLNGWFRGHLGFWSLFSSPCHPYSFLNRNTEPITHFQSPQRPGISARDVSILRAPGAFEAKSNRSICTIYAAYHRDMVTFSASAVADAAHHL